MQEPNAKSPFSGSEKPTFQAIDFQRIRKELCIVHSKKSKHFIIKI